MLITSRTNPKIQYAVSLREKKNRDKEKKFIFDGKKLFSEAINSKIEISEVFCTEDNFSYVSSLYNGEIFTVSQPVLEKLSDEKSPEGIISVAKYIDKFHFLYKIYSNEDFARPKRRFILSSVRDPGNVGTIIRTAAAMGFDELVFSTDCADIYNPKTLRASMGMLFRMRVSVVPSLPEAITIMRKNGVSVYSAMLDKNAVSISDLSIDENTVFVVGNEGHGIDGDVDAACNGHVFIPMAQGVESLNVSSAATVFLWKTAEKLKL